MNSPYGCILYRYRKSQLSFGLVAILLVLLYSSSANAQDPFGADIQLRTGDGALSDTRTLLAEPGDTVIVEFFATNFENSVGVEPSFVFDDLSGVEGTPGIVGNPAVFPIPLPSLVDGNTVTGNLGAAFFSTASVTAATPQHIGQMTVILSSSFRSLNITLTQIRFGGSVTYTPDIQLTITSPTALPKTFAADLNRAAGNQNQQSRRINPGVQIPVQVFGGSLHELTAFEIHAQIESEGINVERTVFEPTPFFSVSAPPAGQDPSESGGEPLAVDDSLASADIQLRTGDGALSDTRTLLAEPGDTVIVEFFATNFENSVGVEPSFVFDDLSGVEGTPGIVGNPAVFPIPLPSLVDGNTVTGNLGAAFFSTASVTAATPQHIGQMTVILSSSFRSLNITLTQIRFGGSVTYTPNVQLTVTRDPASGPHDSGEPTVEIQGNTIIARATAAQAVSGDLPLGRFLFQSLSGFSDARITFTQVVFTAGASSHILQPNLSLKVRTAVTDAPLVTRPPVPATIAHIQATIEGAFSKLGTITVKYGTARDALDQTASSDGPVLGHFQVVLGGLIPNTHYFFQVTSTDDQNRTSDAAPPIPASFRTKREDVNPPRVEQRPAAVDITTNSANILVSLDEGAAVQVSYGTSADTLDNTADSPTPNSRFHRIPLTGLSAGAVFYRVRATDFSDKTTEFPETPGTLSFTVRSEADTSPLRILGRPSVDRTSSGAIIGWVTNKFSNSAVFFGLSQADAEQFLSDNLAEQAQAASALDSVTIDESVREHGITLVNLFSDTTVHYVTRSIDAGGNKVFSRLFNFTTGSGEEDDTDPRFVRAPIISRLTNTEATITFKLNESAVAAAQIATSMGVYADSIGEVGETVSISTPTKRPEIKLTNLEPGTTYYYKLIVTDIAGNSGTNPAELSFITRPTPDIRGPYVFSLPISTGVTQNSAIITWGADEEHTAVVHYEPVVQGDAKQASSSGSVEVIKNSQRHATTISDLVSNTTYRFWVVTTDGLGNSNESKTDAMVFTTTLVDDIMPPTITAIPFVTNITATSATVKWSTDEVSDSRVSWGLTTDYTEFVEEATGTKDHSVTLTDVPSNTDIHFAVGSADQNGNVITTDFDGHIFGVSADHTFHTLSLDATGLPTILEGPTVDFTNEIATVIWKTDVPASSQLSIGVPEQNPGVEGTPVFGQPSELVVANNNLTTNHSLVVTGLLGNQSYLYRVASTNSAGTIQSALPKLQPPGGDGGFTTSTEADTQFPVITSPPNVSASTATSLTIQWNTDEISNSSLTFGTSQDSLTNRDDDGTNVTTHRRVLTNLAPGTTYAYQAGSTDASGNGITLSKVAFGTTSSEIDLTAPVITSDAEIIYKTDRSATLSWGTSEASNAQVSYGTSRDDLVQVRSDPEFNTDHSMTLTNLSPSTPYYFQVSSADQSNNGPVLSAVDSFVTDAEADIINPEILSGSIDSSITDNTATIIWKTNELSDSAVKYGTSGGSLDFTAGSATDVTDHSVTLTNLTPSTQYFLIVESIDRSGNGPTESNLFSFTTLDSGQVQVTLPPTNLQPTEGNSTVLLTWEASTSAGVTGYTVERTAGDSDEFASIATLNVVTSYVDATAQNGTAYRYQIRALGAKQTAGDPSEATAAVTPDAGKGPAAPTLFSIQGDPFTPTLVIKNSSGVRAYSFHVSSSPDFSNAIALTTGLEPGAGIGPADPSGVTAWTVDRPLGEGVTYYWRVQGSDGNFDSAFLSGEFTVDTNAPQFPGDLNGDLVVNFKDFVQFIQLFNTVKGDGNFNEGGDLNRDGAVNFKDFVQFISLFNKIYIKGPSSSKPAPAVLAYGINAETQFQLVGRPTDSKKGAEFAADVVLSNASNLKGCGLRIDYDPALLEFVKATADGATLLQQDGRLTDLFGTLSHDPGRGEIFLSSAITFGAPVEGEGTLVRLHFRLLEGNPQGGLLNIVEGLLIDGKLNIQTAQNLGARLFLVPNTYALSQNYPNPFNPETTIQYAVPEPGRVTLRVFNILGQEVATLVDNDLLAGFYTVRWRGRDHLGRTVASGVYLYRMQAGDFKQIHKMVLLK